MKNKNDLILIGQITGTFGIKGELKVYSESDFVDYRFRRGAKIIFSNNTEHIVSSFRQHKGNVLITIDELYDINKVLDNIGLKIYTSSLDIPPLDENEYYIDQLIGLNAYNTCDELLGIISEVIEIPSGYLLEITKDDHKFLVPFVDAFIKKINDDSIIIEEIEGLR